jgi:anti-sigma factor RsiW
MNCSNWEERIALYLGGDLTPAESAEVERHLGECIGCQVFSSGLKETLALVKEVHQEPIAAAHYTAVRARVLAELEGGRRRRWAWGLAAVAAILLVMFAVWPRRTAQSPARIAVAPPPAPKPPEMVAPAAPKPMTVQVARVRHRRPARPKAESEATESIVMKLQTNDPDIIIYWIADKRKGE